MRAPASPFRNPTPLEGISQDLISTNSGNLVFPAAVTRALMREGVEIDYTKANRKLTEEDVDRINSSYDCFVIPLANMFRGDPSGMSTMPILTDTVRRLKIPCYIVGVGVQLELGDDIHEHHRFDEPSRELIRAVLEKSPMIALRGETTGEYVEHLGFVPEKDFTVTGCPSMYYYGPVLPEVKKLHLSPESRVNLNCKITLPQKIHDYMNKVCDEIPDHFYIPQNTYELRFMFQYKMFAFRGPKNEVPIPAGYPASFEHRLYQENRVRGFVSLKAWMDFLSQGDLNFGTRIHGNITAVLSGIPAFIVAPDSRVNELASFHHIAHGVANALVLLYVIRYNAKEVPTKMGTFPQYQYPHALRRYCEIAEYNGIKGKDDNETLDLFIEKLRDLKHAIGIKDSIREYGVDEKYFFDTLDEMCEQAFNDQCTGANPRYPLISEIKKLYTLAYYGEDDRKVDF